MNTVIEATYLDGNLILSQPLPVDLQGKKIRLLIMDTSDHQQKIIEEDRLKNFLKHAQQFSFKLPKNYQFNREEIYNE